MLTVCDAFVTRVIMKWVIDLESHDRRSSFDGTARLWQLAYKQTLTLVRLAAALKPAAQKQRHAEPTTYPSTPLRCRRCAAQDRVTILDSNAGSGGGLDACDAEVHVLNSSISGNRARDTK